MDGGRVDVDGTPGDDQPDRLLLGVHLTGLADGEHPDDYPIELLRDGAGLRLAELRWRPGSEEGTWEAELDADLGADLAPDATFDLEVRTELPGAGGAASRWVYRDLRVGAIDPCTLVPTSVINDALGTAFDEPVTMLDEGVPVPAGTCHWEELSPGGYTVNVLDIRMWEEITYSTLAATAEAHEQRVDDLGDAAFFDPQSSGRATGTRYDDGTMGYSDFANFNLSTQGVWMLLQASGEIATDTESIRAGLTELARAIVEHVDAR